MFGRTPKGFYEGRFHADGDGHLVADEGRHKGRNIRYEAGRYVFVERGGQSHNDRYHGGFAELVPNE